VNGELVVPEHVQRVGWWDGGAEQVIRSVGGAGRPCRFGHGGYRLFVRIAAGQTGETVVLRGDSGHSSAYRIVSVVLFPKMRSRPVAVHSIKRVITDWY